MAMNPKLIEWERRLHGILQKVDAMLEEEYGQEWTLHPARAPRGAIGNAQYDGLFRLTASFTAGFGSEIGRGYVFRVEIVTLERIPPNVLKRIEESATAHLRMMLAEAFPNQDLQVTRDGHVLKIHGDLGLGSVGTKLAAREPGEP